MCSRFCYFVYGAPWRICSRFFACAYAMTASRTAITPIAVATQKIHPIVLFMNITVSSKNEFMMIMVRILVDDRILCIMLSFLALISSPVYTYMLCSIVAATSCPPQNQSGVGGVRGNNRPQGRTYIDAERLQRRARPPGRAVNRSGGCE